MTRVPIPPPRQHPRRDLVLDLEVEGESMKQIDARSKETTHAFIEGSIYEGIEPEIVHKVTQQPYAREKFKSTVSIAYRVVHQ